MQGRSCEPPNKACIIVLPKAEAIVLSELNHLAVPYHLHSEKLALQKGECKLQKVSGTSFALFSDFLFDVQSANGSQERETYSASNLNIGYSPCRAY
jgi:hypothetical protein